MSPRATVEAWVDAFNAADVDRLAALYAPDAVNHQVVEAPIEGREAIRAMFAREFALAEMVCLAEAIYEDGDCGILEWRDPLGLRLLPHPRRADRVPARLLGPALVLAPARPARADGIGPATP